MSTIIDIFSSSLGIVSYVLTAVATLKFCKKLNIRNGWLGFIPFASTYMLGKIAEACCVRMYEQKKYAVRLLIFKIISAALLIPAAVILADLGFSNWVIAPNFDPTPDQVLKLQLVPILLIAFLIIFIIYVVLSFIALNKIYNCFSPEEATLFTVLSIIFDISFVFLFISSTRDLPDYEEPNNPEI